MVAQQLHHQQHMMTGMTGNVIEVQQFNHGMHADTNIVTLANIEPDTEPVLLTDFLDVDDQVISVANTTAYATFNGISTSQGFNQD